MDVDDEQTILLDDSDCEYDEIHSNNWRFLFQRLLRSYPRKTSNSGAQPLFNVGPLQIRLPSLPETPLNFPLSSVVCSRLICEHGRPLSVANKYDFCGAQIYPTAWQIDGDTIEFPSTFSSAVRSKTFEHFSLTSSMESHFDVRLSQLFLFGPSTHPKTYHFDDKFFFYQATILVFLPSMCSGGTYRFIDDHHDEDEEEFDDDRFATFSSHRYLFDSNDEKQAFILILPPDCQHEIEPIHQGFQLLLVYHLTTKISSIDDFYSKFCQNSSPTIYPDVHYRLDELFSYWRTHLKEMPRKFVIPLQHPFDYSPYFSFFFREKFRQTLQMIEFVLRSFSSSFLLYSSIFEKDSSRLFVHHLTLINSTTNVVIQLDSQHERTILPNEFLGELYLYNDIIDPSIHRTHSQYQMLVVIPYVHQWDLLFDRSDLISTHLFYTLSLPSTCHFVSDLCLSLIESIVHHRTTTTSNLLSFDQLLRACVELRLRHRSTSTRFAQLIKEILQLKTFREQFFSISFVLFYRFVNTFLDWPNLSNELGNFFRYLLNISLPMKITELCKFLRQFEPKFLRIYLINIFLRFVFKRRTLPRHILLSTLCSIFHLLIVDRSFSNETLSTLAFQIVKRVRKFSSEHEILHQGLQIHLIPMLIQIHRDRTNSSSFDFIYQFSLNKLNYFCSSLSPFTPPTINPTLSSTELQLVCRCSSCSHLHEFLRDEKSSTLILTRPFVDPADRCLRQSLNQISILTWEYQHDVKTGEEKALLISKCEKENEEKQICFHLRRLLTQFDRL